MICPYCQADNRDDAKYCNECGMPLSGMMARMAAMVDGPEPPESPIEHDEEAEGSAAEAPLAEDPYEPDGAAGRPAEGAGHPVDPGEIPAIMVEGVNADASGRDWEAVEAAGEAEAGDPYDDPDAFDDVPSARLFSDGDDSEEDEGPYDYEDPFLGEGYVSGSSSWNSEDTVEMPSVNERSGPRRNERAGAARQEQKPPEKKRRGGRLALIAVAVVAAVLVAGVAGASYYMELWGGKTVPDVVGRTQADASYLLDQKGFKVSITETKSDDTEGVVLGQNPAGGSRKDKDTVIEIQVSTARLVPEVVGLSRDEAKTLINDEGLLNIVVETEGSDEAKGTVLSVSPEAGTKVTESTAITLTVAEPYSVPDVTGKSWEEACETLEAAGYAVESTYVYDEEAEEGSVVSTEPEAGTELELGSTVTLSLALSRGDELETASFEYLASLDTIELSGTTYQISSVDGVSYQGDDTIAFTVTARAVGMLEGEMVSAGERQVNGTIVWNEDDTIQSVF